MVLPGLGYVLAFLIVIGGLAFNIGNIAGAGLGFQVIFGVDPRIGAAISALIAILIFVNDSYCQFIRGRLLFPLIFHKPI